MSCKLRITLIKSKYRSKSWWRSNKRSYKRSWSLSVTSIRDQLIRSASKNKIHLATKSTRERFNLSGLQRRSSTSCKRKKACRCNLLPSRQMSLSRSLAYNASYQMAWRLLSINHWCVWLQMTKLEVQQLTLPPKRKSKVYSHIRIPGQAP